MELLWLYVFIGGGKGSFSPLKKRPTIAGNLEIGPFPGKPINRNKINLIENEMVIIFS